jgi:hypothetical protein
VRKILFCFSGAQYHETTRRIVEDGPRFGATDVWVVDDVWLVTRHPQHWEETRHLWSLPGVRGVNWFAFKPFVILDMLRRCQPGDVLLYVDADTYPIHSLAPVFAITTRDGHMVFRCCAQLHRHWCTSACFQNCGIPVDAQGIPIDRPRYYDTWHGCARFMGLTLSDENLTFLQEWYRLCLNVDNTTFDLPPPSRYGPENPALHQHRTEQAIMTNLVLKRGWRMWREACQFGEVGDDGPQDRDAYGQLFHQDGHHTWSHDLTYPGSYFRNIND